MGKWLRFLFTLLLAVPFDSRAQADEGCITGEGVMSSQVVYEGHGSAIGRSQAAGKS